MAAPINLKNTVENLAYIIVFAGLIALNNKFIVAPMFEKALEEAGTEISQEVAQDIKNKFNVKKGGVVDANVQPIADPTQNNTVTENTPVQDSVNCIQLSDFTEGQQRRIKRWMGG